jgi:hypothetical protein
VLLVFTNEYSQPWNAQKGWCFSAYLGRLEINHGIDKLFRILEYLLELK